MKARVIKGGWWWKGVEQVVGEVIEETAEWIAHRVRDGLMEVLGGDQVEPAEAGDDEPGEPEDADAPPAEETTEAPEIPETTDALGAPEHTTAPRGGRGRRPRQ